MQRLSKFSLIRPSYAFTEAHPVRAIKQKFCHTLEKNALIWIKRDERTLRIYFLQSMVPEIRSVISSPSTLVIFLLYLCTQRRSDYLYDGAHSKFGAPSEKILSRSGRSIRLMQ